MSRWNLNKLVSMAKKVGESGVSTWNRTWNTIPDVSHIFDQRKLK